MCNVNAHCPNCGQPNLDQDETSCLTLDGMAYREYKCHECHSTIVVHARNTPIRPRIVDVPLL